MNVATDRLGIVMSVYKGSDGEATRALYAELAALGPAGEIALNLFRACKCSERAKVYRGGRRGFRGAAYERKQWSIDNLTKALALDADALRLIWGWGIDEALRARGDPHHHVLYVELPTGQVSFHSGSRGDGPDFPGAWDGKPGQGPERICRWAALLLAHPALAGAAS